MKKIRKSRILTVLFARKAVVVCACILLLMILASILAPVITVYDPDENDLPNRWQGSSFEHPLGTDGFGRDILTRIIFGGRISIIVGFVSVFLAGFIGMIIGLVAGMQVQMSCLRPHATHTQRGFWTPFRSQALQGSDSRRRLCAGN